MTIEREGGVSCEDVVRWLWEYLDGELDDDRREQIRQHLSECEHCHGQFTFESAFLRTVERLIDEPIDTVPLRQQVIARLRTVGFHGR